MTRAVVRAGADTPCVSRSRGETRYSGFKKMEGVLFAQVEQNYTGGRHTATTAIETIVVSPTLAEGEFRP